MTGKPNKIIKLSPISAGNAWIFSYNQKDYDVDGAMSSLQRIDWGIKNITAKGKVKENDVVYLYGSKPVQAIMYRCRVVKSGKTHTTIDDTEFGGNPSGTPGDWVEIEIDCKYANGGLSRKELLKHGFSGRQISQFHIKDLKLIAFLQKFDADKNHIENVSRNADKKGNIKEKRILKEIDETPLKGKEREAFVNVRVNQGIFRERLLKCYPNKCCLCDVESPQLLVASHIKPWSECKEEERLDSDNGFLMCPSHDKLFDKHLITFENDGSIRISDSLTDNDRKGMHIKPGMKIKLTDGNKKYLKHHRKAFK